MGGTATALGIDVGGTSIKAGLVNNEGTVSNTAVIASCKEKGYEYVLKQIEDLIVQLNNDFIKSNMGESVQGELLGVGLALPGAVNDRTGQCLCCPNLGWSELDIGNTLEERTGLPVKLINDANAASLGEYYYGGGRGTKTFVSITLGTGVGSGLILDGKLFNGISGTGMEAGHMVIEPDGHPCTCGRKGCWETLVSAPGIIRRAKEGMKDFNNSLLERLLNGPDDNFTPEMVFAAYREGDPLARKVVEDTIAYLAIGLANLINLVNPCKISLGGGVAEAEEIFNLSLVDRVNEVIYPTMRGKVGIYKATQGYYGGIVGAASLWLHQ
jgi:glucokinase